MEPEEQTPDINEPTETVAIEEPNINENNTSETPPSDIQLPEEEKPEVYFGRPSLYREEYCQQLVDYFTVEEYTEREVTVTKKDGSEFTRFVQEPTPLRFLEDFAWDIGVSFRTLERWTERYPDFRRAYTRAKELQKAHLIKNATAGRFDARFAIFTAKNITSMRDKTEVEHSGELKGNGGVSDTVALELLSKYGKPKTDTP
jgi:hypothetical protein